MPALPDDLEALRTTVEQFARDVIAPVIGDLYERHEFPYDIVRQMGEMGLFGLPFPEEHGGMGGDYFALCIALEELARVDSSVAITLEAAVSLGAMPIHRFGTPEQKAHWLPELVSGRMIAGFGLTEPGAGSTATSGSSPGRSCGTPAPRRRTGASSWPARTSMCPSTRASPTSSSTCTNPAWRCGRSCR